MIHFHKWTLWSEVTRTTIVRRGGSAPIGYMYVQTRTCGICGLTQFNKQRIDAND
jgi:hypothetical protein